MKRKQDTPDQLNLKSKRQKTNTPLNPQQEEYEFSFPWLDLYKELKSVRCSPTDDYRQFKSWLGVAPVVAEMVWIKYSHSLFLSKRIHLAIALNYLKCMPCQQVAAADFHITAPTYRKYLWKTLEHLDQSMTEVCQ